MYRRAGGLIETDAQARLDRVAAVRPLATGEGAYAAWAKQMGVVAGSVGSLVEPDEKKRLDVMLSVKPCAMATSANLTAAQQLGASMPSGVATAYLSLVAPATCQ